MSNYGHSPLSSRHGSQESLRHYNTMGSMSMLQTPTSTSRDAATAAAVAAQKKKGLKSSLGRFFSKKEKVILNAPVSIIITPLLIHSCSVGTGERCQGLYARWIRQHDVNERHIPGHE